VAELAGSVRKLVAMIDVPDIERALEWYQSIGFRELARYGEDGELNFGMVSFGKAEVMFRPGGQCESREASLWFYTSDVDKLYTHFKSLPGIEFVEEIYDPFYGGREFGIRDVNGYCLYFLQPAGE
jgi:uncharacterized glyoxalase superfamily protein PhnB